MSSSHLAARLEETLIDDSLGVEFCWLVGLGSVEFSSDEFVPSVTNSWPVPAVSRKPRF